MKKKPRPPRILDENSILKTLGSLDRFYMQGTETIGLFRKKINEKRFRVADTSLSYRQVNHLDYTDILNDNRKNKNGWRKFSLKELIFFSIIKELRKYGFRDEQLKTLKDAFFGNKNKKLSDFAIGIVFTKLKITLIIDNENELGFYDDFGLKIFIGKEYKSYININLNEIVMEIWEKIGKKKIEYQDFDDIMDEIIDDSNLNEKELEIMKIIRSKDYKSITVRKSETDKFIIKGETNDIVSENNLMKILKEKDFADISITKRNGRIVNIKIEETRKV